jgi:hypothetical protein
MIGILYDPESERFEANLDGLETTGVQFDPSTAQNEVAKRPAVQQILADKGGVPSGADEDQARRLPAKQKRAAWLPTL